ncbi:MAG TPA: hypothetical protein VGB85_09375 [Nannocystis sp.]|jgi:hypothetical protein
MATPSPLFSQPSAQVSLDSPRIVSAQEHQRSGRRALPSFGLRFPTRWRPAPLQNPHADAVERETLRWLAAHGIGVDADEREKLRQFNCAMYGGYSLPTSDYEETLLVTQFISLWLFWDDMQVEEHQDWDIDEVVRALDGEAGSSSRYVAAWADIGRRLQAKRSRRWLRHLACTMRQWLENAKFETGLAKANQRGVCPDFQVLFECRTISIGMFPTFHLIEHAEGFELPDAFHQHETTIAIKRLASRLVGLGNDLGGLAKDLENRWLNLVLALTDGSGLPLAAAFQRVVDIHNADVAEMDRAAARLPSFGAAVDALAQRWVQAVRYNVHGFTLWEATAERYQARKVHIGDTALVAPVVYVVDPRRGEVSLVPYDRRQVA